MGRNLQLVFMSVFFFFYSAWLISVCDSLGRYFGPSSKYMDTRKVYFIQLNKYKTDGNTAKQLCCIWFQKVRTCPHVLLVFQSQNRQFICRKLQEVSAASRDHIYQKQWSPKNILGLKTFGGRNAPLQCPLELMNVNNNILCRKGNRASRRWDK